MEYSWSPDGILKTCFECRGFAQIAVPLASAAMRRKRSLGLDEGSWPRLGRFNVIEYINLSFDTWYLVGVSFLALANAHCETLLFGPVADGQEQSGTLWIHHRLRVDLDLFFSSCGWRPVRGSCSRDFPVTQPSRGRHPTVALVHRHRHIVRLSPSPLPMSSL